MSPERLRKMEMSRLELTSISQENAAMAMGLGERDKSRLRQAITEFRDATLFRLEHPSDEGGPRVTPYGKRQSEILGTARYEEFSRLEQQEREKMVAERRAFRGESAASPATK